MNMKWNVIKRDHNGNQLSELSTTRLFVNKDARIGYETDKSALFLDGPVLEVKRFELGISTVKTKQHHYTIKQVED